VALMSAGIWATPFMAMLHARPSEEFSAGVKIASSAGGGLVRGAPLSCRGDRFSCGRNQRGHGAQSSAAKCRVSKRTAAAQPSRREPLLMPHSRPSRQRKEAITLVAKPPL
jgi:hypothetical protein